MNIALPALVVFLILLPGFLVRSRFKRVERLSLDYSPFGQVVTEAVLWASGIHLMWLMLASLVWQRSIEVDVLLQLIAADATTQAKATAMVAREAQWIAAYFGSMFIAAYAVPAIARRLIARYRWDRDGHPLSNLLRFHGAPWYYLLTGADFPKHEEPDLILVSAVVDVAGDAVLYVGVLEDFFLDEDGRLDRLIMGSVMRRALEADKALISASASGNLDRFYPIDGDYFVLRYAEATTLNIEYIKLQPGQVEVNHQAAPAPALSPH